MATMNAPTMDRRVGPERRVAAREGGRSTMSAMDYIAMVLLIVGGLNWAMVGLFNVDLVATLFGPGTTASRVVYILVGAAAMYSIYTMAKMSSHKKY